jgi:hypothetical protein
MTLEKNVAAAGEIRNASLKRLAIGDRPTRQNDESGAD